MALVDQALDIIRGDSKRFKVTVTDDQSVAVNLDEDLNGNPNLPAVLKFSVKNSPDDPNAYAMVFKASYDAEEIEFADQTTDPGVAYVMIRKEDTYTEEPNSDLRWDIELYRQGDVVAAAVAGTISVTAGSGDIVGVGTAFTNAKVGDILIPVGGTAPNLKPITITEVTDDTNIKTDYTGWDTEAGMTFSLKRGDSKTISTGGFTLIVDQTR